MERRIRSGLHEIGRLFLAYGCQDIRKMERSSSRWSASKTILALGLYGWMAGLLGLTPDEIAAIELEHGYVNTG